MRHLIPILFLIHTASAEDNVDIGDTGCFAFVLSSEPRGFIDSLHPSLRDGVDRHAHRHDIISGVYLPPKAPNALRRSLSMQRGLVISPDDKLHPHADLVQADAPWHLTRSSTFDRLRNIDDPELAHLPYTWDSDWAGQGTSIYLVDSGGDCSYDWFGNRCGITDIPWPGENGVIRTRDLAGHGTAVMGACCSSVHGHARRSPLQPLRIYDTHMEGTILRFVDVASWIFEQLNQKISRRGYHSTILLLPSGTIVRSDVLDRLCERLDRAGVLLVTSAGNDAIDSCRTSPGHLDFVVTVGATNPDDQIMIGTGFGPCVNILAPGQLIRTSGFRSLHSKWSDLRHPRSESVWSGTSMAAGVAAGAIAVFLDPLQRLVSHQRAHHNSRSVAELVHTYLAVSSAQLDGDVLPPPPDERDQPRFLPPQTVRMRHKDFRTRDSDWITVLDTPGVPEQMLAIDQHARERQIHPRAHGKQKRPEEAPGEGSNPREPLPTLTRGRVWSHRGKARLRHINDWPVSSLKSMETIYKRWQEGILEHTTRLFIHASTKHPFAPSPEQLTDNEPHHASDAHESDDPMDEDDQTHYHQRPHHLVHHESHPYFDPVLVDQTCNDDPDFVSLMDRALCALVLENSAKARSTSYRIRKGLMHRTTMMPIGSWPTRRPPGRPRRTPIAVTPTA
ncbi:hypothetical protein PYCC9005_005304 [Savitreella phatthalungensis]